MSIFEGRIREFSNVFVDNFNTSFLVHGRRQAFFLSHAHSDHMRGLDSTLFQNRFLSHDKASFFASAETKELLSRQSNFRRIAEAITVLPINEPRELRLDATADTNIIYVSFLPAQHCPGSVSIYFVGNDMWLLISSSVSPTPSSIVYPLHHRFINSIIVVTTTMLICYFLHKGQSF